MMMILKSMGVDVNKTDMENYSSEVDEEETGKFNFTMFCQKVFLSTMKYESQWLSWNPAGLRKTGDILNCV